MKLKLTFAIALLGFIACTLQSNNNKKEGVIEDSILLVDNYLIGTKWRINDLLCLNEKMEKYTLAMIDTTERYSYGNLIRFSDSTNFVSYYTAWCGNDCFTTVFGKYKLLSEDEVAFSVDSVTYRGDCYAPTEYRKAKDLRFVINRTDSAFYLEKEIN